MEEKIAVTLQNKNDMPAFINAGAVILIAAIEKFSSSALAKVKQEEIPELKESAEALGAELHLLVNRLFHETEVDELCLFLKEMDAIGIRTVWFADPAVLDIKEKEHLSFACIYMPDTLLTSRQDMEVWHAMGTAYGVISPLLNRTEEKEITCSPYAVVPVHGHMVMSRSYRHLLSGWQRAAGIDARLSENTHLTIREKKREDQMPIYEDETGTLIYTDYVLCSFHDFSSFRRDGGIYLIDSVFMDRLACFEAVHSYRRIIEGENAQDVEKKYREKFPGEKLSEGYYGENVQ